MSQTAKKNSISLTQQSKNRELAATNASNCLAHLMTYGALRRHDRGLYNIESSAANTAHDEAKLIASILEPFGIKTNHTLLTNCLYGRRGPIPAYFHWRQYTEALHFVDFKILSAMGELPQDIVTPTPLVTIRSEDVTKRGVWYNTVNKLVGAYPTSEDQINEQLEEISGYLNRLGYSHKLEMEILAGLQVWKEDERPELMLNLIRYMLGQLCHRRMFVFVWEPSRQKWDYISHAFNIWFAMCEWDTIYLDNNYAKKESPGKELVIEPGSYESLKRWLKTSPSEDIIEEFVNHFSCHHNLNTESPIMSSYSPTEKLNMLMKAWDSKLFGIK